MPRPILRAWRVGAAPERQTAPLRTWGPQALALAPTVRALYHTNTHTHTHTTNATNRQRQNKHMFKRGTMQLLGKNRHSEQEKPIS